LHGSGGYIGWVYDEPAYEGGDELIRLVPTDGVDTRKVRLSYKGPGTTPGLSVHKDDVLADTT
jgi:hypothetical protein